MPTERHNSYEEMSRIGRGAYGTVYKAKHRSTGQVVALKKVCVPMTEDGMPMNTLREVALLKQLNGLEHPNIVRLLDVCPLQQLERELTMFLVFEYMEQDLSYYMDRAAQKGHLDENLIRSMCREVLSGVDFLHSNRIIHRDLKPQNLLVTNDGHIKLADFGLAKTYSFDMQLTSVVVTLWYRAPEVLLGIAYATSVDIWSIGCIIAEMYLLKPLFCGTSEYHQLSKIFWILGKPTEDEWPSNVSLQWDTFDSVEKVDLEVLVPRLRSNALDLVKNMLTFNPSSRLSAYDALNHPYFKEPATV